MRVKSIIRLSVLQWAGRAGGCENGSQEGGSLGDVPWRGEGGRGMAQAHTSSLSPRLPAEHHHLVA